MAAKLNQAGMKDFIILEKATKLGGTWRENTYLGAECDIPSALYSYSFWPNPTWDFKWAKQKQILKYMNDFAKAHNIGKHIHFDAHVRQATYRHASQKWQLKTANGKIYQCQNFVPAIGQLHHPYQPEFPKLEDYQGVHFHSAKWRDEVALKNKRVAVVGNAASAVQLIPEVAQLAKELTIYQRSPNWVINKGDRPYTNFEKAVSKYFPVLAKLYRLGLWMLGEYGIYPVIKGNRLFSAIGRAACLYEMKKFIKDPEMIKKLTPDYPIGAKRILFSDKYYATLVKDNVTLVTDSLSEFTPKGIRSDKNIERAHDVVIFATGFITNPFFKFIKVRGQAGLDLQEHWKDGAQAYQGIMTHGFPNMFMLYGPNTNTGHTSIIYKIEAQVGYIVQLIKRGQYVNVKKEAEARFNDRLQKRLRKLAWSKVEASWYKSGERVTLNWAGSAIEFKRMLKSYKADDFEIVKK